ncbi:CE1 family esterase [Frankia nepalensis]|uniref:alpha/beta hydrolase family esterase n=1 Tax=Frankia nepalensis TaxID=1836974 RepID=UPI0019345FFF|nr:PHB depolymerase family esterase [Frankia nepalensis]MBL7497044.1 plasmid partitioning protein [Frankia nepalensis]MBL7514143.1 plasmid partitioning protein [Frankia nepalensis]
MAGRAGARGRRAGSRRAGGSAGGRASAPNRTTTVWLPIAAALVVVALLLGYAFVSDPGDEPTAGGDGLAAAAARAGYPEDASEPGDEGGDGGGSGADDGASVIVPVGPSGCETGKTLPAGVTTETVTVGKSKRSFLLAVPADTPAGEPRPLILNFHAAGQPPTDLEAYTGLAGEATKQGYVVVDPAGVDNRWNFASSGGGQPDDIAFVAALLADLRTRGCLADGRVFATGFGDGADMAVAASCALPGRIAAIVSVAGSVVPADCEKPITNLFEIHGAEDPVAPWDGGGAPRATPSGEVTAQPVTERLGRYARGAGCDAEPTNQQLPGLGELTAWACDGKPDVGALRVARGGHTWPQAEARPDLGPTATSFSATVVSLLYFRAHPVVGAVVSPTSPGLAQSLGDALAGG